MSTAMTRSRLVQVWFAAMALVILAAFVLGVRVTLSTGAVVLALSLAVPAMLLKLWPGSQPKTIGDVLRDSDGR
jgi:hypothetical protein